MAGPPSLMSSGLFAGRYSIERVLGQGATATVHLARDTQRGISVAIKIMRPELAQSKATDRFLKEIRRTAHLQHPHILRVLDSGEHEGRPYFVLPYMEGGTLRWKLRGGNQLTFDETVSILRTVAEALDYAHTKGLIHRDVKPENILFTGGQACLGDFGIARALETVYGTDGSTSSNTVRGTYAYMSPEQAAGGMNLDGRSDIYSLACVAYEMITGMQAFIGPTPEAVVAQRFVYTPREVRVYRPSAPLAVDGALAKAFAMSPADRYRTAAEFVEALAAATANSDGTLGGFPQPPPPAPSQKAGRSYRLSPRVAIPAVILVAAVSVALARWEDLKRWVRPGLDSLGDNVVAIAPFDVLDPTDTLWRHGFVDLLSRNFDGAGPLRTVPPSVVIKNARGRVDAASAWTLAQRTGAGLVVFGQLLRAGADSARLMATMVDVKQGVTFHVDLRDHILRFDRLADSLTFAMLRELGRTRTIAAVPRATLGSRSMPALKAFLQGEQLYRANNMSAASEAYQRAIAQDTTFALAYRRMRGVFRAMDRSENDSLSFVYALKAGAMNHGLSPRDSLLVVADSLAATNRLGVSFYDPSTLQRIRRRMAALEMAARNYSSDPEAWYELGEARFHFGERVGITQRQALDAFLQSLRLDPNFGPAYYHVIDLTQVLDGTATALAYVRRYLQLRPDDARFRVVAALMETEARDSTAIRARFEKLPDAGVLQGLVAIRRWPDRNVIVPTLSQRLMTWPAHTRGDSVMAQLWASATALYRGQLRLAYHLLNRELLATLPINYVHLAQYGVIPRDSASNVIRAWLSGDDLVRLGLGLGWWSAQRDTVSLHRAAQRFDSLLESKRQPRDSIYGAIGSRTTRGYLALARNDTTGALEHFLAVPDSLCSWLCGSYRLTTARLLAARGEVVRAAAFLDLHPPSPAATTMHEPLWAYERARLAELTGDTATATRLYTYVADVWAAADVELQPALAHARSIVKAAR